MKTINVTFEDEEFEELTEEKGNKTWRDFILELVENQKGGDRE